MTQPENVLFVVIDQLRADCLWGALADHAVLPNIRALADDAMAFRNHYSVANPCGPARASLLTGQYAMNHRSVRNGTPLPHDKPNLATEARKAGYQPLLFGYTDIAKDPRVHHPNDPAVKSYEEVIPGFDEVVEMRMEESIPWRAHLIARGYDVPDYPDNFRQSGPNLTDPALYRAEDSDTAFLTDQTIAYLRASRPGWFAHLTYLRPHPPLVAPEPWNRLIDPASLPLPVGRADRSAAEAAHPFVAPALAANTAADMVVGFPDLEATDDTIRTLRALYLGLAAEVDHHLGRLIAWLKDSGQYDRTLIVVTADHGEMLGDHHAWGKMNYHAPAWHVPLIIRDPRATGARGIATDAPTESIDITPTILDWVGQARPTTMDGRSLLPLIQGDTPPDWRSYTVSELDFADPAAPTIWERSLGLPAERCNLAILRTGTHVLVHFNGGLPPLLFDRRDGPGALNRATDPAEAPLLLALTQQLLNHRMAHAEGLFARTRATRHGHLTT
ncbi:sulfatase-like hydrolase/transferase [Albidovulum sediminicola]|uniref:Sulfatase-like hydrolase/transferase n=1 Tax=Albidovulum sediminicola TaxID=2984331 RepID=A0ABT2YY92_9RHOB|nr:sulfatase-like hydrolase/transferase [Defluviimonas sp. WL0075]MCV2863491.1 sulfatase-like hydrolase/transferase [Defluviimonas sp. WL0075]